MGKIVPKILSALDKVESLRSLGAYVIGSVPLGWLGTHWDWLASQGWAAITIFAIMAPAMLLGSISLGALAILEYKARACARQGNKIKDMVGQQQSSPKGLLAGRCPTAIDEVKKTEHEQNQDLAEIAEHPHQGAPLKPESIFVGWINISARDFTGELLEIDFYAFNASGSTIDIVSVSGSIDIEFIDCARGGLSLLNRSLKSSTRFVNERGGVTNIKTFNSFKFKIEQHIMPELMDEISKTSNMRRMRLNFDSLNVAACRTDDKNETVRVPLWRRADFRRSSGEGVTTWVEVASPQEQPSTEI